MNVLRTRLIYGNGRYPIWNRASGYKRNFHFSPQELLTCVTDGLQAIHHVSNVPWWALIPLTTFTLRGIGTLPLAIIQRKLLQKQSGLRSVVSATNPVLKYNLAKKVQTAKLKMEALSSLESTAVVPLQAPLTNMKYEELLLLTSKETRRRQKALFKQHKVQLWKNFILPACQIPLWVTMSLTFRNLSGWTSWNSLSNKPLDPTLCEEGLLWFNDLTISDPYHIIPLVLGTISLCNIEWTFKTLEILRLTQKKLLRPTLADSMSNISRMSIVFMMAIAFNAPVALSLFWLSLQLFSLIQNIFLDIVFPINYSPIKRAGYSKLTAHKDAKSIINASE